MDEGARGTAARRLRLALVALASACLLAALGAPGAGAIIARLADGHTLSFEAPPGEQKPSPFDQMFTNLDYNGGPVMASNTNYTVYWAPAGAPAYPTDYQPGVDRYLEDLAHDSGGHQNVDSVSAQYNDTGSFAAYDSRFAGAILDSDPYPVGGCAAAPICLSDAQIRAELSAYLTAHGLPADLAHEYFLLTPPGVASCFEGTCSAGTANPGFCAYHASIAGTGTGTIIYANIPYLAGGVCDDGNHPNGTSADASISALSHEHNESLTDPEPNTAWTDWATGEITGFESADKCRVFEAAREFGTPLGTAPDGAAYNQLINGHEYWTQQEWSNAGHGCAQRFTLAGAEPNASFTSTYLGTTQVTLDAGSSSAPGGVAAYAWQFNDGTWPPLESTSATITHDFPSQGVWNVALTVFAADGTSIGSAHSVLVGTVTLPSITKVSPRKGPAAGGTSVTITGAHLNEVSAVHFGSLPAASFTAISPSKLTAISPAGTAGKMDIRVTTPQGTSAVTWADHFTLGPPTVTRLKPATGPLAGGTLVYVTGSGFALGAGNTRLKFGGVRGSEVTCSSITSCTVRSPKASLAAEVDVVAVVSGSAGKASPPSDLFTYHS